MKTALLSLSISSLLLSACAMQQGDFPSLAKRPYEDVPANADPVPASGLPTVSSLPSDVQAAVDNAAQQSSSAHSKFLRNLPAVKSRVNAARGAAVSSEAWVVAQMDLASLEMDRSPSVEALAEIDSLYIQRLDDEFERGNLGGAAIIAEKRELIDNQVRLQQDEIDSMKDRLR
ncbi:hypothetical protein [Parasphingorhabdus halotolerans]|uniref:Uncharacterized protein n=1 Tax=Parasphingorhabdus halotolerans TaxID=2725558 RepID=A0A6H2DN17_9SPHN|nr:hypothetical protein [Parasphingorhabdus halotolerans]QJB70059.1 hypothetical protein HF685_12805 [Parasphingorhabdus halotolerans]